MLTAHSTTIYLFVNGELPAPVRVLNHVAPGDQIIAVDGGLRHIINLKLTPSTIIGDLDSADPMVVQSFQAAGSNVIRFPVEKNETDLELALDYALTLPTAPIRIVAALGGRLDQTLANIFLLTQPRLADRDIRLMDGNQEVFVIRHTADVAGAIGDRLSLLPLNGPVHGIQTRGLAYPLANETLLPDHTRGISNRLASPDATISIRSGLLLCIHETLPKDDRL